MGLSISANGQATTLGRTIEVPLDYKAPEMGRAPLYFEFGASFDPTKPVVFIIADGQQFYVRRGSVAELQHTLFGDAFNVVGIVGRGFTPEFIKAALDASGHPDWVKAWRILNSEQWIDDIESVRKNILGDKGRILLYGRSGGAYLVHQYLTKYGAHAQRAFTMSPVNPIINRELGIEIERFWEEIGAYDRSLQPLLRKVLEQHADDRVRILMTLQRQHFFVTADKLAQARAELIRALAKGDTQYYENARKEYQVDDVLKLNEAPEGITQNVRVAELIYPSGAFQRLNTEAINPLIESQYHFLKPLVTLIEAGKIPAPAFDISPAHRLETEVFVLAGRGDEVVDYRTSIALAYSYPQHQLFIADDNHVLTKLTEAGLTKRIVEAFLRYGLGSSELQSALKAAEPLRWSAGN
jgi:pimeloyl-ACP methyl ester carboxylesterase